MRCVKCAVWEMLTKHRSTCMIQMFDFSFLLTILYSINKRPQWIGH